MDVNGGYTSSSSYTTTNTNSASTQSDEEMMMMLQQDLRRGPWTVEEDLALINYIANHGEGRWNSLARCAGLKRTGKSCRLRWLNYLRPDVRRGNITLEEQLIILELHSRWGNRWSKIAQHLPGRTDNEIKNYWRTRVQKHAKQLQCDVNSKQFKDTMRYLWMPRLVERIQAAATTTKTTSGTSTTTTDHHNRHNQDMNQLILPVASSNKDFNGAKINPSFTRENSRAAASSPVNNTEYYTINNNFPSTQNAHHVTYPEYQQTSSSSGYYDQGLGFHQGDFDEQQNMWLGGEDMLENSWNVEDLWFLQQQFNNNGI